MERVGLGRLVRPFADILVCEHRRPHDCQTYGQLRYDRRPVSDWILPSAISSLAGRYRSRSKQSAHTVKSHTNAEKQDNRRETNPEG